LPIPEPLNEHVFHDQRRHHIIIVNVCYSDGLLGEDIVSVHAKDVTFDETKKSQAAGSGMLDYDCYFRLIKQSGYAGPVILHNLEERQVDAVVNYLRRYTAEYEL
jgi:L-ribulose-5-phosphate 3-epimerase UlaE